MHARGGRPAQPEERDRVQGPAEAGERETPILFVGGPGCVAGASAREVAVVEEGDDEGEEGAEGD